MWCKLFNLQKISSFIKQKSSSYLFVIRGSIHNLTTDQALSAPDRQLNHAVNLSITSTITKPVIATNASREGAPDKSIASPIEQQI
jgi:hypothetical protein